MYRDKFNPQSSSSYDNPAAISSNGGGGQGYGGYGQNQESSGVISNAVGGLVSGAGTVISGASSVLSTGISYLGWKGTEQSKGYTGGTSKMMGFGSNDNYSGYMGGTGSGGGTNYAPPGGSGLPAYSSDSSTLNPGATKWGTQQQTTASSTQYKPMGNFEEK